MSGHGPDWFAPKRFGVGAGLPIAWQGWAISALYAAVVVIAAYTLQNSALAMLAVIVPATAVLIVIAARTTRGGWRWRWGGRD